MKMLFALILVLVALSLSKSSKGKVNWAVLVAGSKDYKNYRHQADTFHAYQLLIENGVKPENIIVFAYDDIASNKKNPFPGQVFNNQQGKDVYAGVKIDYRRDDVTPRNYINVLTGNKKAMKGIGTGRVLESTSKDNVFLYFTDHGSRKLIVFPNEYLYAPDLIKALKKMHSKKMYKELVFYLEACYSGSMFAELPTNLNIYATTAANAKESSYAKYCYPRDLVDGKHIGSCLGDQYSSNWMEKIEEMYGKEMTLKSHYDFIKSSTLKSHVMVYGDKSMGSRLVNDFINGKGSKTKPKTPAKPVKPKTPAKPKPKTSAKPVKPTKPTKPKKEAMRYVDEDEDKDEQGPYYFLGKSWFNSANSNDLDDSVVDSQDAYLYTLEAQAMMTNDQDVYNEYQTEKILVERSNSIFKEFRNELNLSEESIDGNTDFDCLKFSITSFKNLCGLEDRDIRHLNDFTNACTVNTTKEKIQSTLKDICSKH